jgi:hypothetical protein
MASWLHGYELNDIEQGRSHNKADQVNASFHQKHLLSMLPVAFSTERPARMAPARMPCLRDCD